MKSNGSDVGIDMGNTNYGAPEQTINGQARYGLKGATPRN
jgi:hypothetical protein